MHPPSVHLRRLRMDAGLSIPELAKQIGYSRKHVYDVETGRQTPGPKMVFALAGYFGKRPSELDEALRRDASTTEVA